MLHLCIGLPGTGKTKYLMDKLINSIDEYPAILIVPDQLTFEREKQLLHLCSATSVSKYEVLSFKRLNNRISREYGGLNYELLGDTGKLCRMIKAISLVFDKLVVLKRASKSTAFAEKLLDFVAEYKRNELLFDETVEEKLNNCPRRLKDKYNEIRLIISAYESIGNDEYIDEEDELTRLHKAISKTDFFHGKNVYIDGFKDFTAQQMKIIEKILCTAQNVYFAFTCDSLHKNDDVSAFEIVKLNINRIIFLCHQNNIAVESPVVLQKLKRYEKSELQYIAENLHKNIISEKYEMNCDSVNIIQCNNRYEEVKLLTANIKNALQKGARYSDMSVIAMNISQYNGLIEHEFSKLQIPYYIDSAESFAETECFTIVKSLLCISLYGIKTQYMLYILKMINSNFKINEFEKFLTIWSIEGSKWNNSFDDIDNRDYHNKNILSDFENIRSSTMKIINNFLNEFKIDTAKSKCTAIFSVLKSFNFEKFLQQKSHTLQESGNIEGSKRIITQWNTFISILDQFVISVGDLPISDKQFFEIFCSSAQKSAMVKSPSRFDEISVGSARLIRPASPKIVFILGVIEGEFPSNNSGGDLLSAYERKQLLARGISVNDSSFEKLIDDRYVIYTSLCLASEALYLSYCVNDFKQATLSPAKTISRLLNSFTALNISHFSSDDEITNIYDLYSAFSKSYYKGSALEATYIAALKGSGETEFLKLIDKTNAGTRFELLADTAKKLSKTDSVSPTRVESFYKCQFYYFCKYMLSVKPLEIAEINIRDRGKIIHFVLDKFFTSCINKDYIDIEDDKLSDMIDKYFTEYMKDSLKVSQQNEQRFIYQINIYKQLCVKLVRDLINEINQSEFSVGYCELEINKNSDDCQYNIVMSEQEGINITGFIDRVDVYKRDGVTYVKIVDYKTGMKKFELADTLYGQNLQMMIYLFALKNNVKKLFETDVLPAGIVYVPTKIEKNKTNDESDDQDVAIKFASRSGIILEDSEIINAMQKRDSDKYIPVIINKNGELGKHSSTITLSQLDGLEIAIKKLLIDMNNQLVSGVININPLDSGESSDTGKDGACKYCDYLSVCKNEQYKLNRQYPHRDIEEIKAELEELSHGNV